MLFLIYFQNNNSQYALYYLVTSTLNDSSIWLDWLLILCQSETEMKLDELKPQYYMLLDICMITCTIALTAIFHNLNSIAFVILLIIY